MKLLKYALYAAGGLVLLGLIALVAFVNIVDGAFLKSRLEREMKEDFNRTLAIEGTPRLSLFPAFALELGKTRLSEPDSEKEFLSLDALKLGIRLAPLLRESLQVDALELSGLRVNLVRAADGKMNFNDLAHRKVSAGGAKPPSESHNPVARSKPFAVHLAGARIERVNIAFRDEATGQTLDVAVPKFEIGPVADATGGQVAFVASVKGAKPAIDVKASLMGKIHLDLARESFEVTGLAFEAKGVIDHDTLDAALAAPEVKVTPDKAAGSGVRGSLQLKGPKRHVDAKFRISALEGSAASLSIAALSVDLDANVEGNALKAHVETPLKASLTAKSLELPAVTANLTFSGPAVPQKSVTLPLRAAFKADIAKQSASGEASVKFDESSIHAKFAASKLQPVHAKFDLSVDRLNLDRYLSEKPSAQAKPDKPIDLSGLKGPTVDGHIQIGALQVKQAKLQNIKIDVKLSGGKLSAPHYSAGLYSGTLDGSLAVDSNTNQFKLANTMKGVFVGPLLRDVLKKDLLEGRGNLNLDLQTAGTSIPALKRALAGSAKLELKDGAIKGINLAESLRNFKASLGSKSAHGGSGKQTDFSEMSASFAIRNGVARNDDLKAASPFLRLAGAGSIDIGNSSLDYLAKATLVATTKGQGGPAEAAGLTVPVKLNGPLDNPSWHIDYTAVLGSIGGGAGKFTDSVRSLGGKTGGGLKSTLKGLFGK